MVYLSYVFRGVCLFRLQFNATVSRMWSVSNIFALQTTFQHEQCLFMQNEHSFTMGENGEERDAWEK